MGVLDEIALAELSRAPTIGAVVDTLATWRMPLARPLHEGLRLVGETESLQPVEFELDRFVFLHALEVVADGDENDAVVRRYLRLLVDRTNLLTVLRYLEEQSALSPLEAGRHFLEGNGRLTRARFEAIAGARNLHDGLARLASTVYGQLALQFARQEVISLPLVERQLDRLVLQEVVACSREDPLGIGLAIAFAERKINEVRNLRMIVQGKAAGMIAEQISEWLIMQCSTQPSAAPPPLEGGR
ncbi:MAG: hypothetical protein A3A86_02225 [Elusimicrobia bacterium RIFCSPLOWO2_01_FULL_60_11]|nr:MAG: hypothetical protein A3A86_02225 [Elusimicrobia bacterium RIFCSPLOWO2_01_FULL_60_11]